MPPLFSEIVNHQRSQSKKWQINTAFGLDYNQVNQKDKLTIFRWLGRINSDRLYWATSGSLNHMAEVFSGRNVQPDTFGSVYVPVRPPQVELPVMQPSYSARKKEKKKKVLPRHLSQHN